MENKKKSKWFVETPQIIVELMHKWLVPQNNQILADFTAGKWQLFNGYNSDLSYGIEIDEENYNHVKVKYKNVVFGDFFEQISNMPDVDCLILNPPYIKTSNEIIYKSLQKLKDWWRFAIISKDSTFKKLYEEYPDCNINISMAMIFDDNLFKPFASVKTILMFWEKGKKQSEYIINEFSNNEIKVNTRSKFEDIKILHPKDVIEWNWDFWEKLNEIKAIDTIPTLEDFEKTIIDYMAWDTWFPAEFIRNPKKLWEWYNKLLNFWKKEIQ